MGNIGSHTNTRQGIRNTVYDIRALPLGKKTTAALLTTAHAYPLYSPCSSPHEPAPSQVLPTREPF